MLQEQSTQRLAGLNVLIVDDDSGIRSLLGMSLSIEGCLVRMAAHGQAALDAVRAFGRDFDLIVLDLDMPVMDGRTCFRELRAIPCATPVLVLSAYGSQKARRELGANAAMDKPFDPFVLADRVVEMIAAA